MLFNNLVSQSGGGTYTKVSITTNKDSTSLTPIPDSATIIAFVGKCISNIGILYVKGDNGFTTVEIRLDMYSDSWVSNGNFAIKSTNRSYNITGTLIYM